MYLLLTQSLPLIRDGWSFDYDDLAALILAMAALLAVYVTKRHSSTSSSETIDGGVLDKFLTLTTKVATLESEIRVLQIRLTQALKELTEVQKVEEYLRAVIHDKDKEIEALRLRVTHLEKVCRQAGINGDDWE